LTGLALWATPDYGLRVIGICLRPTTSKGPAKDDCKIFWTYVTKSIITLLFDASYALKVG